MFPISSCNAAQNNIESINGNKIHNNERKSSNKKYHSSSYHQHSDQKRKIFWIKVQI